jgi:hypothetical protein
MLRNARATITNYKPLGASLVFFSEAARKVASASRTQAALPARSSSARQHSKLDHQGEPKVESCASHP